MTEHTISNGLQLVWRVSGDDEKDDNGDYDVWSIKVATKCKIKWNELNSNFRHCWCYSIWLGSRNNWNSNCVQRSNHEIVSLNFTFLWPHRIYANLDTPTFTHTHMYVLLRTYSMWLCDMPSPMLVLHIYVNNYASLSLFWIWDCCWCSNSSSDFRSCCCGCFHSYSDFEWQKAVFGWLWFCCSSSASTYSIRIIAQICRHMTHTYTLVAESYGWCVWFCIRNELCVLIK